MEAPHIQSLLTPSLLLSTLFAFMILRTVYRLTLHPLAKIPGPKLAAITSLYWAYYDLPFTSSYLFLMPGLHDKYGSVIRIAPNHLHVRDLDSYNQVFKQGTKYEKDPAFYCTPITVHSLFNTCERGAAKTRKDMFQPYFSRAAIQRLEPAIKEKVMKWMGVLREASEQKQVLDMTRGFACLTADVVMQYQYDENFGALDAPWFQFKPMVKIEEFFNTAPTALYLPNFFLFVDKVTKQLPAAFIEKYMPPVAALQWIQRRCRTRVAALATKAKSEKANTGTPTVFDTMLHPDPAKGQYTPELDGLQGDACLMFVAGAETTANTFVQGTFHVLSNPHIKERLQTELKTVLPSLDSSTDWATLEKLPYLRAVIKESLRFSYGVPGRIPRIVPEEGAVIAGYNVPAGTSVGHSAFCYHTDDAHFENAREYRPERWLESAEKYAELDSKMLSFSRGPRGCLGINLAYSELYLGFAYLFRHFEMELVNTTKETVDWIDTYTPKTKGHLRLRFKEVSE